MSSQEQEMPSPNSPWLILKSFLAFDWEDVFTAFKMHNYLYLEVLQVLKLVFSPIIRDVALICNSKAKNSNLLIYELLQLL